MSLRLCIAALFLLLVTTVSSVSADDHNEPASASVAHQETNSASDGDPHHEATPPPEAISPPEANPSTDEVESDEEPIKNLPSDVRVLIDVSGSMKKTDPQNLRKPALDLIVRLLPDKSRAGVWLFGNEVNMLMSHKVVDADWRKQAVLKAEKINSISLYTNIGKALDEVGFDKENSSPDYKTHIVLLTDGVVDISKDSQENIKERQRILTDVLPRLKHAGYAVHTIALSENADTELLKSISIATDGVFTTALSADELTSTFLKIFDQAVPAERVPLEDNGFLVDASVKEFTALVFRKLGVEKSVIQAPNVKEYSATSPQDGVNWYRTNTYDLITTEAPVAGRWKIKTEITPQSRITVVSNLQLVMQPLKNNINSNNSLALNYFFQENGETVTNIDFLNLLETNVIIVKAGSKESTTLALAMPEPPADGIYHQSLNSFAEIGDYEIHIFVDGKTFKREFKHSLSVRDSFLTLNKSHAETEGGKITYSYKITPDQKLVDITKTKMIAAVKNSKNNNSDRELDLVDNNHWEFSFSPEQTADYTISFRARGKLIDGDKFNEIVNAETFTFQEKIIAKKPPQPKEVVAPVLEIKPENAESNNMLFYIIIGVGNVFMVLLAFIVYRFINGNKNKSDLSEIEKTLAAEIKPIKENPADKKTSIDLNDEKPADIPVSNVMPADNLFPLDNMENDPVDESK